MADRYIVVGLYEERRLVKFEQTVSPEKLIEMIKNPRIQIAEVYGTTVSDHETK